MAVPRTLFHGVPEARLKSILEHGLLKGTVERANFEGFEQDVQGCVFLADSVKDARFFGLAATISENKGKPKEEFNPDFVVLVVDSYKASIIHGVPIGQPKGELDPAAFEGKQYVACGDIPQEVIVGYLRVFKDKKTGKTKEEYVRR